MGDSFKFWMLIWKENSKSFVNKFFSYNRSFYNRNIYSKIRIHGAQF